MRKLNLKQAKAYANFLDANLYNLRGKRLNDDDNDDDLENLMAEIHAESMIARKKLVKKALADFPDTSADAIGEHYYINKETARALCKGMGARSTKNIHNGNDYEFRKVSK